MIKKKPDVPMILRSFRYYLLSLFMLILPMSSCGPKYKAYKAQKQQEKRIEQKRKEGERAIQQGKKRHHAIQSTDTKKRMKESQRRSKNLSNSRNKPFYKRWYDSLRRK
jgi:hypothetical protein